jgi:hypothetical protein
MSQTPVTAERTARTATGAVEMDASADRVVGFLADAPPAAMGPGFADVVDGDDRAGWM